MMTETKKKRTTGQDVLKQLVTGNTRYAAGERVKPDPERDMRRSSQPQFPKAAIVSCLDSRVPVENIFNMGVGDLFVARVAGNVINEDIVGSLEFAVLANNVKLVLVLGHTGCGAVKGSCAGVQLGSLTQLLEKIKPAVEEVKSKTGNNLDVLSDEFADMVTARNAAYGVEKIKKLSPEIADLVAVDEVMVVAAVYNLQTQQVEIMN